MAKEGPEAEGPEVGGQDRAKGLKVVRGAPGDRGRQVGAQAERKGNVEDSGSSGRTLEFTLNSCDGKVNYNSERGVWFFGLRSYLINVSKSVSEC